jgi:(aminoalkyl)phosphonate N-acetyltransferase
MQIRKANIDDFEAIYHFINELEDVVFEKASQFEIYQELISNPRNIMLVAENENILAGFINCHVQYLLHHGHFVGEIQEMFVKEEFRSSGIGKKLISELKEAAKASKIFQLEVTSSWKRTAAHAFYEREGFVHSHKKFVHKL